MSASAYARSTPGQSLLLKRAAARIRWPIMLDKREQLLKELPELAKVWQLISSAKWNTIGFDLKEAYVCCILSSLAYAFIPEFELRENSRFKVVPSNLFRSTFLRQTSYSTTELQRLDFGDPFVIFGQYTVVIGMRMGDIIFVAVRGTAGLYDWRWNVDFRKVAGAGGMLHRGFSEAANESLEKLKQHVDSLRTPRTRVYITGHSLGGAITSILFGKSELSAFSAYTFGMPRYGDRAAVSAIAQGRPPHHIRDRADIVPSVPPKWSGFGDSQTVLMLDEGGRAHGDSRSLLIRTVELATFIPIKNHFIDNYRAKLGALLRT
jgi:hypothetical protein